MFAGKEEEVVSYVFNNYYSLMTLQEKLAYKSIWAEEKAQSCQNPKLANMIRQKWISSDPTVMLLVEEGANRFKSLVVQRLLQHHSNEIYFNYCPRCHSLARTPVAKQCPKCFYSWHNTL